MYPALLSRRFRLPRLPSILRNCRFISGAFGGVDLLRLAVFGLLMALSFGAGPGAAAEADDPFALAFKAAQEAQASVTSAALSQLGARFAAGSGDLAHKVRERQDLVARWRTLDRALVATSADDTARAAELKRDGDEVKRQVDRVEAELAARFPEFAELSRPRPLDEAEVRALLEPGETLLMVFAAQKSTHVFAINRDTRLWHRAAISHEQLVASVRHLRAGLDPRTATLRGAGAIDETADAGDSPVAPAEPGQFDLAAAHELYQLLLAPVAGALGGNARLLIATEAPLDALPFHVLLTEPPDPGLTGSRALGRAPWLLRRHSIVMLPGVGSLKALRANRPARAGGEAFRGFGAPRLAGPKLALRGGGGGDVSARFFARDRLADVDAVRRLSPLPETAGELKRLATALGADPARAIQIDDAATETAVKTADLSGARILAFATHGLVAGEIKGLAEPALVFTPPAEASDLDDGLLTASEAANLKLSADWVVLSACNTASSDGEPGADGLSGLARAFFYAGARALIVSHWPVRDDAAARITTGTFAALAAEPGLAKAEAFRRSMLALIEDGSDPGLAHPSVWAPFVVVGEGR